MHAGIAVTRPEARIYEIGRAIESVALPQGYSIVREFIGHGIGDQFHTSLQIPQGADEVPLKTASSNPSKSLGWKCCVQICVDCFIKLRNLSLGMFYVAFHVWEK